MVEGSNSKGKELKKRKAKAEREYIPSKKKLRSTDSKQRCSVFIADRNEAYFSEWEVNSKLNVTPAKNDGTTIYSSVPGNGPVNAFWSITVYDETGHFQKNDLRDIKGIRILSDPTHRTN
jgi:hypothetical protein